MLPIGAARSAPTRTGWGVEPGNSPPALVEPWFPREEYERRLAALREGAAQRGVDGLLLFQPETITWLTGYFTRGYGTFQFVALRLDGDPVILCRDVEAYYHDRTSAFPNRRLWADGDDPLAVGLALIEELFGGRMRIGLDLSAWPLNAARYRRLASAMSAVELVDVSELPMRLRLVKSPAEIRLMRLAGRAAEAGMAAAAEGIRPGVSERELAAAICRAMILAGSDIPGPGVLSSGEGALHLHGSYTDRVLQTGDTVQLETIPCVRHYHARFMRPIKVARASKEDHELVRRIIAVQDEAFARVKAGTAAREADAVYRQRLRDAGITEPYSNKTFYSVGLLLAPSGGEPLEASPSSDWLFEEAMTFHSYLLVRGFGISETILVTKDGHERLTNYPRQLIVTGG